MKKKKSSRCSDKLETIVVDLTNEQFMAIAMEAHKRDVTFNQMCNIILEEEISKHEAQHIGDKSSSNSISSKRTAKKAAGQRGTRKLGGVQRAAAKRKPAAK